MNTKQKREGFNKDLDKLMSGNYVLVPKDSVQFCAEKTIDHIHDNILEFGENPKLEAEWRSHAQALLQATGGIY